MIGNSNIVISAQTKPGNSQHIYLVDTTYLGQESTTYSATARAAAGPLRDMAAGYRVVGTALPTGQTVTVTFEILGGDGAWVTDTNGPDSGSKSVTATTLYQFNWMPSTPEYRVRITAGATAPTTLDTTCVLIPQRTSGV